MRKNETFFRLITLVVILFCTSIFASAQEILISNEAELREHLGGRGNEVDLTPGYYKLTSDITLTSNWNTSWRIGPDVVLDGDGHTIYGLKGTTAFFTYLRGTIKNLGFENAEISGGGNLGAIFGIAREGLIENCWVKNSIISGNGNNVGGIVGSIESPDNPVRLTTIKNCFVDNCSVTGSNSRVGGIVGNIENLGNVIECYVINSSVRGNGDEIVGGVAGRVNINSLIEKCYTEYSTIYGNKDVGGVVGRLMRAAVLKESFSANTIVNGHDNVGGVLGRIGWHDNGTRIPKVENCYSSARVNAREWQAGGVVGQSTDGYGQISNCYFSGVLTRYGGNRASGILGLMGADNTTVENCVNLAALVVSDERYRIVSFGTKSTTVTNNYALETLTSTGGNANENGLDVSAATAKTQAFYEEILGWDFNTDGVWKMVDGGYPVLQWQTDITASVIKESMDGLELKEGADIDLSALFYSGNGLDISFSSDDAKISITGTTVQFAQDADINDIEIAEVKVSVANAGINDAIIQVKLIPGEVTIANAAEFISKINMAPGANFKLTADIDFTNENFNGISTFSGSFDGDGYVLKNIILNNTADASGIFKTVNGATIKNVVVDGATVQGGNRAGILVGQMNNGSVIEQCAIINSTLSAGDHVGSFAGNMAGGSRIENCYSTASVTATASWTGGIVGLMDRNGDVSNVIKYCYNTGNISNNGSGAAGIVGRAEGALISENKNTPQIHYNVNLAPQVKSARIVGACDAVDKMNLEGNYSLNATLVNGNPITDGTTTNSNGADVTAEDAKTEAFYSDLGWNFTDVWKIEEGEYPVLQMQQAVVLLLQNHIGLYLKDNGSALSLAGITRVDGKTTPIIFSTESQVVEISDKNVSIKDGVTLTSPQEVTIKAQSGESETIFTILVLPLMTISTVADFELVNQYPMGDFELEKDIELAADYSLVGLCSEAAPFTGTFDGKGNIIKGLKYDNTETDNVGLFRRTKNATIKNLGLMEVNLVGRNNVAGITAYADGGLIEQCFVANSTINASDRAAGIAAVVTGNVRIKECYVDAAIIARAQQSGGIAGASFGEVTIEKCYFAGTITGGRYKASILGWVDADADVNISNCLNLATELNGGEPISRIVTASDPNPGEEETTGRTRFCKLTNNYSISTTNVRGNTSVTGTTTDKNGANLSDDDDAKGPTTFYTQTLGWDFTDVWNFILQNDYPVLKLFYPEIGPGASTDATESIEYDVVVFDNTMIVSGLSAKADVTIFNINGQMISNYLNVNGGLRCTLPAKGAYLVAIVENGNRTIVKVISK